ncbi:NAD(P)H-binding protein [Nonomuraea sp. NN258]|uniref:SDR family oxidoreductase n=1 Tax=Nonomuraea antri TaxID=2730852 RepID=UPI0015690C0E|nr:NAD(P)H-binding protein [Nonomuraea antri]NRQ31733.1 NAD(P)H-binding protein [Nonomuraea antri]
MRILVTGATGTLGRAVVPALAAAGHTVRALSRTARDSRKDVEWVWGDLALGDGVADALREVDAVVHLATSGRGARGAGGVDLAGTRRLIEAARANGSPHLLFTSVVGVDRVPDRYLRTKLEAERLVRESGLSWTILRATQFHQWLDRMLHRYAAFPVLPVDRSLAWQPVDVGEVAGRITGLVNSAPGEGVVEYGGPQLIDTDALVRTWLKARRLRRPCLHLRYPGKVAAAVRERRLTTDATPAGTIAWHEYLFPPPPVPSDDFAAEHTASPTSPATQPERDPDVRVYGGDEGYERPTRG